MRVQTVTVLFDSYFLFRTLGNVYAQLGKMCRNLECKCRSKWTTVLVDFRAINSWHIKRKAVICLCVKINNFLFIILTYYFSSSSFPLLSAADGVPVQKDGEQVSLTSFVDFL